MKFVQRFILIGAAGLITAVQVSAAAVDLAEVAFNVDGVVTDNLWNTASSPPVTAPIGVNIAGFNTTVGGAGYGTGLGTITYTFSGTGSHYFGLFVDHEINQTLNGFVNQWGSATGALGGGQTWEIGDPCPTGGCAGATIFNDFLANSLNGTSQFSATSTGDVSMAMGWNFTLAAGDTAYISLVVSQIAPSSGFYLTQSDLGGFDQNTGQQYSPTAIYLSSALNIRGGGGQTPEPATLALVSLALMGVWQARRRAAHS